MGKLILPFILISSIAAAEQDFVFPGSTVQGDILRGEGQCLKGAAWFELFSAQARAIDTDTAIKWAQWNQSVYDAYRYERANAAWAKQATKNAKKERAAKLREEAELRLRTNPTAQDVERGDALNALLVDLSKPSITLADWSKAEIPLPAGLTISKLAFQFVPRKTSKLVKGCLISLGRLQEKWPVVLPDDLAGDERKAYEAAYKKVEEQCLADKLHPDTITEMDNVLKTLRAKALKVPEARGFRTTAIRFVENLTAATKLFDGPNIDFAEEMIRDTHSHEAQTVGQLLAFMRKYRLMFAAAEHGIGGVDSYAVLYGLMQQQKEKLGIKALPDVAEQNPFVELQTTLGTITLELDRERAPLTVDNFLRYLNDGFYDGLIFHRVIPGFVIQSGGLNDKLIEKRTRGSIRNEAANGLHNFRGSISMARTSDPNSATSQFFISVADNRDKLDPRPDSDGYAVFGRVVSGMNVVDEIVRLPTITVGASENVPRVPVYIKSARRLP